MTIVPADNRRGKPNHDWLAKSRDVVNKALTHNSHDHRPKPPTEFGTSPGTRPPSELMKKFVGQHRQAFGVESICKVLQITPQVTGAVWTINVILSCDVSAMGFWLRRLNVSAKQNCGSMEPKVCKQLNREGISNAPCTVPPRCRRP